MEFIVSHWEGILALIALITTTASTLIAYYTFKIQRDHNIKSVKPIIHVGQWDYENNLYVTLQNVGPGLGIVRSLSVYNDSRIVKGNLYEWLPKKLDSGVNYKEYWTPYKSFVIQPSQVIKLIEIPIDTNNPNQIIVRESLRDIIGKLTVQVEYLDIYDNLMPFKIIKLTHFARTDNVNTA